MSKKRKKDIVTAPLSDNTTEYYRLWVLLQNAHEEKEFDVIRKQMNEQWIKMSAIDKKDFHREALTYEVKYIKIR